MGQNGSLYVDSVMSFQEVMGQGTYPSRRPIDRAGSDPGRQLFAQELQLLYRLRLVRMCKESATQVFRAVAEPVWNSHPARGASRHGRIMGAAIARNSAVPASNALSVHVQSVADLRGRDRLATVNSTDRSCQSVVGAGGQLDSGGST